MSAPDIAGVLAAHYTYTRRTVTRTQLRVEYERICICGEPLDWDDPEPDHRAHVAAVLREQIGAAQAEALRAAADEMAVTAHLPEYARLIASTIVKDRAAQLAPSRDGLSAGGGDGS